jgi:hypothetical protein
MIHFHANPARPPLPADSNGLAALVDGEGKPVRKFYQTNKPMIDNRAISVKPTSLSGR